MKRVIEFPLEGGGAVLIEVEAAEADAPIMRGGPARSALERSAQTLEAAVSAARPIAAAVVRQFGSLVDGTSSVRVKFGLTFSAEAGAIIASAGSEANFEIEVKWRPGDSK